MLLIRPAFGSKIVVVVVVFGEDGSLFALFTHAAIDFQKLSDTELHVLLLTLVLLQSILCPFLRQLVRPNGIDSAIMMQMASYHLFRLLRAYVPT